jgi:hypothetical protein
MLSMKRLFLMLIAGLTIFSSCKKDKIAPANQKDAFVKYYGHIRDQKASDIKSTADGGYLLLGSSNSFASTSDDDFYLIKTDSLGNEEWSKSFGDGEGGFDEEGVSIAVLANDEGYLIAGNRTKMVLVGAQTRPEATNIVLYKLDLTGNVVWEKVLRVSATPKNDWVKEIKQTPEGEFVLIGETTKVFTGKNDYPRFSAYDKQDILVLKLDADANIIWESLRGFIGVDYGSSIEFVNGAYIIIGTVDVKIGEVQNIPIIEKRILSAKLNATNGNESIAVSFGGTDMFVTTAYSCYDSINGLITIIAHVDDIESVIDPREGDMIVLQVTENIVEVSRKYYGKTSGGINGIDQNITAGFISSVPPQVQGDQPSFIITGTHGVGNGGSEIMLLKLNPDLSVAWNGQARFFGRPGENGNWLPGNEAEKVLPIEELVPGTSRKELKGFAFTATFNMGTNNMIGLVKTNAEGTMTPVN